MMLGNLTIDEMQARAGVMIPDANHNLLTPEEELMLHENNF